MTNERKGKKKPTNGVQPGTSSLNTVSNFDRRVCRKVTPNIEVRPRLSKKICATVALSKNMM